MRYLKGVTDLATPQAVEKLDVYKRQAQGGMGTGTPSSFCLLKCMKNDVISKIDNDSPLLHKAHIGDEIVSINGNVIHDVLDYKYFSYEPVLHIRCV